MDQPTPKLAHNVSRLGHLDLPGAGQVLVEGNHAYIGHITNKEGLGTSILDIADRIIYMEDGRLADKQNAAGLVH